MPCAFRSASGWVLHPFGLSLSKPLVGWADEALRQAQGERWCCRSPTRLRPPPTPGLTDCPWADPFRLPLRERVGSASVRAEPVEALGWLGGRSPSTSSGRTVVLSFSHTLEAAANPRANGLPLGGSLPPSAPRAGGFCIRSG